MCVASVFLYFELITTEKTFSLAVDVSNIFFYAFLVTDGSKLHLSQRLSSCVSSNLVCFHYGDREHFISDVTMGAWPPWPGQPATNKSKRKPGQAGSHGHAIVSVTSKCFSYQYHILFLKKALNVRWRNFLLLSVYIFETTVLCLSHF